MSYLKLLVWNQITKNIFFIQGKQLALIKHIIVINKKVFLVTIYYLTLSNISTQKYLNNEVRTIE